MNQNVIKTLGILFLMVGTAFSVPFYDQVHTSLDMSIWFTPSYYTQFIPLFIGITCIIAGLLVLYGYRHCNIYLVLFGHAAVEDVLFNWLGWSNTNLTVSSIVFFLPLGVLALVLGYLNSLGKKPVSLLEAFAGLLFTTIWILSPNLF
ncbi:hypothetical protein [Neptunicella marina]|uniref:Uncharacterized protein n=1 Tax=Neptunicella marina TaxID=2125989 RepID=A0A8J6M0D2_9ALTE|nr:hypothetical protein [Neptunicella marina]MBC3767079.1 hypothetical protein [Neptunicella marina]